MALILTNIIQKYYPKTNIIIILNNIQEVLAIVWAVNVNADDTVTFKYYNSKSIS